MMPTIGFNEYNNLHFPTTLLLNPTGEIYSPNCTTNGTINLKSLYFTFKAATHNPVLRLSIHVRNRKKGRYNIFQTGTKLYQNISTTKIAKEIKKSTKFTITVLAGIIIRGKYILVSMLELVISELLASLKDVEKNCHGSIAAYTRMG